MKKNLLLIECVFASIISMAQPIPTGTNTNLVVGETNGITSYNWIAPGNSGANQTWNFSSITTNTNGYNMAYTITTVPSSITAEYPNANIVLDYSYGGNLYTTNSSVFQANGVYDPTSTNNNLVYQDPMDLIRYPFTYGNSFTDTYSGTQGPIGFQQFSKGTSTITADGYGTISLPGGTFSNVLRIHVYTVGKDSSAGPNQTTFVRNEYWWFMPNNHYPLLQNATGSYGSTTYQDLIMLNTIWSGISETTTVIKSFNLYPNPNSGKVLNIDLNLTEHAKYEITIVDNLGREVLRTASDDVFEGYNFKTIDVSELASGIYNLGIILENEKTLNRKITIQK